MPLMTFCFRTFSLPHKFIKVNPVNLYVSADELFDNRFESSFWTARVFDQTAAQISVQFPVFHPDQCTSSIVHDLDVRQFKLVRCENENLACDRKVNRTQKLAYDPRKRDHFSSASRVSCRITIARSAFIDDRRESHSRVVR